MVMYGRKRVGKTTLCLNFSKDKSFVYLLADRINHELQVKNFAKVLGRFFNDPIIAEYGLSDWEQLFLYISQQKKKFVLIIDDFDILVENCPKITTSLSKCWDLYIKKTNIFIILCGSDIRAMEEKTLSFNTPLYGKRTGRIFLRPFEFYELCSFFGPKSFDDLLKIYSVFGGIPAYLKFFQNHKSFFCNLKEKVLDKEHFLYNEVECLLKSDLREPKIYYLILQSISSGPKDISDIIKMTGLTKATISSYLYNLNMLSITKKEVPITELNPFKSRRSMYQISDPFTLFWFRSVLGNRRYIEENKKDELVQKIKSDIKALCSQNFKNIARKCTPLLVHSAFGIELNNHGKWWDKKTNIDIAGYNYESKDILFGEAVYSKKPLTVQRFRTLQNKAKKVNWYKKDRKEAYILFSPAGFDEELKTISKKERLLLIKGLDFLADKRIYSSNIV